jgi:hypothetical protein
MKPGVCHGSLGKMDKLFSASAASDSAYLAVRDQERFANVRSHLRVLWEKYSAYVDPRFLAEIGHHFHQRYWEMRLGCTLLDLGFVLKPAKHQGPDFDARTSAGKHVYIEAVAVRSGVGSDAVPGPNYRANMAERYPTDQIVLRTLAAIDNKSRQHASHVNRGIIDPAVPYVIAVNIGGIPGAFVGGNPPTLAQACLGVGSLMVVFDPDGVSKVLLDRRDAISKASKCEVDTRIFLNSEYSWLTGALLSDVSAFRLPLGTGDFQFFHNPGAKRPVDRGWLPVGSEHWVAGNRIHNHYWPEDAGT